MFDNWTRKPKAQLAIIPRDVCRLRMAEWQSQPHLVKIATELLNNPKLRLMLDVLRNEALQNVFLTAMPIEERAFWQARSEGYSIALNNIEALGKLRQPEESLEVTYESPEQEKEQE